MTELLSEKVLARNAMDITKIQGIREEKDFGMIFNMSLWMSFMRSPD
ncbi:MAG: hypothetical protein HC939_23105 [Pleurocapsa sp. SU_5_0]|nr:hypothetical protein [Pleurocapsa sp. SU_5_0]NJO97822.1 hypothetical protein [Pleurocapsa sp. CRU_1_2]NJR45784.1 hypothetical protein [Hyellaceae cyanobacterium CSU_1_1]